MSSPLGLDSSVLAAIKKILLDSLKDRSQLSVSFFGSRANGKYKQYSDLDLWIECRPSLSLRDKTKLLEQFEESDLAITIDIVTPETCLPEYLPQIQNEKKLWFCESN